MVKRAKEVCLIASRGGNLKSVWWNDQIKAAVKRKVAAWKEVLGEMNNSKERYLEVYREEESMVKRCIYQSKMEINEQFGSKTNQNMNGNRKLFWKEVSKVKDYRWRIAAE